jgi:ring-1,2-phenylacetyl-CoA epoxidase subunit PaaE
MSELRVAQVDYLTKNAYALTFEVPEALQDEWLYRAGQHLTIVGADGKRRSFSLCDAPAKGRWRVGIKRLPGGVFSAQVAGLQPGDTLEVLPPSGRFSVTAEPTQTRHHAFLGAGSGVTPLLAMMQEFLLGEMDSQVTLLLGNKRPDTVMFVDDLQELKMTYGDRFQVYHFFSEHPSDVPLFNGRLDGLRFRRAMRELVRPETVDDWWICGPHRMIEMLTDTLLRVGVDRSQIHSELFHVEQNLPSALAEKDAREGTKLEGTSQVTITYRGETTVLEVPKDGSDMLRHAIIARPDLPYSCRGGVCGTCRALVTAGSAAMHSWWALEKEDVDAGYVLGCQSYPLTDSIALDFDS